jgi:hypothetical protein
VSARIVQFAIEQQASILVFEHLGNLRPEKGTYSRRSNMKRAYWMKERIFKDSRVQGVEGKWSHHVPRQSAQYEPGMPSLLRARHSLQ